MENLLFVAEERLPSPDSVRLLYHVTGGQVKHNPCPLPAVVRLRFVGPDHPSCHPFGCAQGKL